VNALRAAKSGETGPIWSRNTHVICKDRAMPTGSVWPLICTWVDWSRVTVYHPAKESRSHECQAPATAENIGSPELASCRLWPADKAEAVFIEAARAVPRR
jgi:hypothetical protein